MNFKKLYVLFIISLCIHINLTAQELKNDSIKWLSLGVRNTISTFTNEGFGLGTGGQFRIQLSNRVNTDWFADYISIYDQNIRNEYLHIGWSVLFYPIEKIKYPEYNFKPFILAGHCFDYNIKTVQSNALISSSRWGSAVQAGIGTHLFLSERFDVTLMTQYMIHLTQEINIQLKNGNYVVENNHHSTLQGHLLTTLSLNYKLLKLWRK